MSIKWVKYVPRHLKGEYEALGWQVSDSLKGLSHGDYSYIGVWKGEGDPKLPESEKTHEQN